MKFLLISSIFLLSSCLALPAPKTLSLVPSNSMNALERKPFVSPEQPAALQSYKRIKRETSPKAMQEFQTYITGAKESCGQELGFTKDELSKCLLYDDHLTHKEKCLVACILKRTKIMDKSNKMSTRSVGRIVESVCNNALLTSIAMASAENCNRSVNAPEPCEAAYQINKCIANEMKNYKVNIVY